MTLHILTFDAPDSAAAGAWVRDRFEALGPPVWHLIQRLETLELGETEVAPMFLDGATVGRIFGPVGEIRWVARAAGYRLWQISESTIEGDQLHVRGTPKRCYLWGSYSDRTKAFLESHLFADFNKCHMWLAAHQSPVHNDRPYLELVEYFPELPATVSSHYKLEEFLNQPRTVAHRLCGIKLGMDLEG
ncbi:MAG: hypothetical protein ABSH47_20480 [Bryobacteraceae bacterium]|jgi:hypothetical protein